MKGVPNPKFKLGDLVQTEIEGEINGRQVTQVMTAYVTAVHIWDLSKTEAFYAYTLAGQYDDLFPALPESAELRGFHKLEKLNYIGDEPWPESQLEPAKGVPFEQRPAEKKRSAGGRALDVG